MIKIFGSNTSPFTRKVRIVALEKKIEFSFINFGADTNKYYLEGLNPLGKIPVLQKDDDLVFDSPVIAKYLDGLSPAKNLTSTQNKHDKIILRKWEALTDGILDIAINSVVYERRRQADKIDENKINNALTDVTASLELASSQLGNNQYCVGQKFNYS